MNQTITELERVQTENQRQQALLMEQSAHIAGLEHENAYLKNLKVVRIRMYAARIVKGMLRRIKRLFGKV